MSRFLYVALMLFIQANNTVYYVIDSQILCVIIILCTVKTLEVNTIVLEYILYHIKGTAIFYRAHANICFIEHVEGKDSDCLFMQQSSPA